MDRFLIIFVGLACTACLQTPGNAEDDSLKNKIVRATLNQNVPAVIKVGTNGVTSLEFPYKVEAIDGYGFSPTPSAVDGFQISYARGNNFFSVRALKSGVTGNLTVVLDQKVYSLFFRESSDPIFAAIFEPAGISRSEAGNGPKPVEGNEPASSTPLVGLIDKAEDDSTLKSSSPELLEGLQVAEPEKRNSITFSEPPADLLPTAITGGHAAQDVKPPLPQQHELAKLEPQKVPNQAGSKQGAKKTDPKPQSKTKDVLAKTQKPPQKKLFGWL